MNLKVAGLTLVSLSGLLSFANLMITGAVVGTLFDEYLPMTTFILLIFGLYALVKYASKK